MSRLINAPRLTATGLRERLTAFQQHSERNGDSISQTQQNTTRQINHGNDLLARYGVLNGQPSGQGESYVIH